MFTVVVWSKFPNILYKWERDLLLLPNTKLKVKVKKLFYMILPANTLFIFPRELILAKVLQHPILGPTGFWIIKI